MFLKTVKKRNIGKLYRYNVHVHKGKLGYETLGNRSLTPRHTVDNGSPKNFRKRVITPI